MDCDVLIVGAGPSGLMTAGELALAGLKVHILERRASAVESRAGTILPRVLEILDCRGLAESFIAEARKIRPDPLFNIHIWGGLQPVDLSPLRSRYGYRLTLPQNVTEALLEDHVRDLGVTIERSALVESVEQDADRVRLTVTTPDGTRELHAPWVVGADGGRSRVRESLGISFEGRPASFTGIVADVEFDHNRLPGSRIVDNAHGFATSFPFSQSAEEDVTRFNIVHVDRRNAAQDEPVTEEEMRVCLNEIYGFEVPFERLIWASRFTDTMRIVDRLREGRVVLVGEACRIHYPSSGVGMNFCLQDVFNLGWKLASVINGHFHESLLDSYQAERLPVMHNLLQSVSAQCAFQFNFSPEGMALKRMFESHFLPLSEVSHRLAEDLNGLTFPYPSPDRAHPLVGWTVYDLSLITEHGETRIGLLLRTGKWLLLNLNMGDKLADAALFGEFPIEVLSATAALPPEDMKGTRSLLIRPDGYVAWASDKSPTNYDEVLHLLRSWYKATI